MEVSKQHRWWAGTARCVGGGCWGQAGRGRAGKRGGGGGDAGYTGRVADESMGEERREVKEGREEEEPEGLLACF